MSAGTALRLVQPANISGDLTESVDRTHGGGSSSGIDSEDHADRD
jgi:hypothetical protein